MFSAIDRNGLSASSWWMITMPDFSESRMPENEAGWPSKMISPS